MSTVDAAIEACPACGARYGPPAFGLDFDPDTPWQTDSDGVREQRFDAWVKGALKEGLLRDGD